MGSIDWKWMIIGLVLGWFIAPRVLGAVTAKKH